MCMKGFKFTEIARANIQDQYARQHKHTSASDFLLPGIAKCFQQKSQTTLPFFISPHVSQCFSQTSDVSICVSMSPCQVRGQLFYGFYFFRNPSTEGGQWGKPLLMIQRPKGHDTVSRLLGFPLSPHPFTVLNTWGDLVNRAFSFEPGGTGLTR